MPKAESLRNIEPPDDDDWVEILTNFNLSEKRAKLLRQGVVEIAADLNRHIAFERRALQGRDRRETIKHLGRVSKALRKLETIVRDGDPNSDKTLSHLFARELAELLGNRGLKRLLPGHPGPPPPSIHDLDSHDAGRYDGPYDALDDRHYFRERELIARSEAPLLLQRLAGVLDQPLDQFLEVQRRAKGGNPGRKYRNYVIQQLALLYQQIFKKKPTRTRTGRFVLLCELVLDDFDMDTVGLEKAVERTLTRLDL